MCHIESVWDEIVCEVRGCVCSERGGGRYECHIESAYEIHRQDSLRVCHHDSLSSPPRHLNKKINLGGTYKRLAARGVTYPFPSN